MAFRFASKLAKKHQSVASTVPSLKLINHRIQIEALLPSSGHLLGLGMRHFTTSKLLESAPTSNLQSPPLASAMVQELIDVSPHPFQYSREDLRYARPEVTNVPRRPTVKDHVSGISDVQKRVDVHSTSISRDPYWQKISLWKNITEEDFIRYSWQMGNTIQDERNLIKFLDHVLPNLIPRDPKTLGKQTEHIKTREDFIQDVKDGMTLAPMSVRLTPHILSVIDWSNPLPDPVRRQFIPMKSTLLLDHPKLELDSLHESNDSPVPGLVHRYPDKALFLSTSICPVYCRFCTRSYSVGKDTPANTKTQFKPKPKRWEEMFNYIEQTEALTDIVVSGGDSYLLPAEHLTLIGDRLLSIPHIKRFRFATKGLAVCPSRILDQTNTEWTDALIALSNKGKKMGKAIAVHTHLNHPNEITWVTKLAAQKLFENGVMMRNQSVLLRGVNDDVEVMKKLIRDLGGINILPYYVYQGDMVRGVEDLRTPLQTILDIESQIRGTIAGFLTPQFVVDLPGGGGKRLAASYLNYDRKTGISTFVAPAVNKKKGGSDGEEKVFKYFDPLWSLKA